MGVLIGIGVVVAVVAIGFISLGVVAIIRVAYDMYYQ